MIYQPAFADHARTMCRLGATDEELAEHFEVCVRTIYRWRNTHEAFAEAVVAGKEHADARVERALYSRAVGCTVERTKVFKSAGEDPVYATYQHHLPPDPNAALQWLRVSQPKKWGAQQSEEKGGSITAEMVEEVLARAREYRAANPMPSRQPPLEDVAPDHGRESTPVPDPGTCPEEEDYPPPPSAPPPRPIPPGFPIEPVRFGYG
jgi:transposase-like protein